MTKKTNSTGQELVEDLNADFEGELQLGDDLGTISISSRDWTVETIISQIKAKNIDLNPSFQRRNAWNDTKRSRLIESLIWGIPVPQIVLAENKEKPRSFIVIDGKQRLLTIAGFFDPSINYWKKPVLRDLQQFHELNGLTAEMLSGDLSHEEVLRNLLNADIRCTIISKYDSDDLLYEIFLRMNTASTQLSTQELRQVLCRGWFADWLISTTGTHQPVHDVLGIEDSDLRLVDVEVLLRCICTDSFSSTYNGNMKHFLDSSMKTINSKWKTEEIEVVYERINKGILRLIKVLGVENVGRKITQGKFEGRFNRALFEVQQYYFSRLPRNPTTADKTAFKAKYSKFFEENPDFKESVESTTKSIERTQLRFRIFGKFINSVFKSKIPSPF
jgi:hypothetical protein